ncbi:MAG: translation initiation factor [Pseudarcicella sp.]|nr:translation initiation factor [Pseudarcicella sp.]MBP6410569.1 translation initiation factor [Pseudarcicella sp.]
MAKNKKIPVGIVYSTASDFEFEFEEKTIETLPNNQQKLSVLLDKKARAGKKVSIVTGFVGEPEDLETLCKKIKSLCGCGGTAKDNEILIQGDFKDKIFDFLTKENYKVKKIG